MIEARLRAFAEQRRRFAQADDASAEESES
jgi:hypothetical protein